MDDAADELVLDGNAAAGVLAQVFGHDVTTMIRRCDSCGQSHSVGRHRAYRGAGWVLRCPHCGDVAGQIAERDEGAVVRLHGTWFATVQRRSEANVEDR